MLSRLDAKRAGANAIVAHLRVKEAHERLTVVADGADIQRSVAASRGYQARALQVGKEAAQPVVDRMVVSETAQAFNEAILEQARQIQTDTGAQLERAWSAEAGACPVCAELDGTVVDLNESFPSGEPGSIHPHCRCIDEIRVKH